MVNHAAMKLGRRRAFVNPRLPLLREMVTGSVPVMGRQDWFSKVATWPMLMNDQIGDCTCAAVAHVIQQWTAYTDPSPIVMSDKETISLYSAVSDYPANDSGAVCQDVLEYWRLTGAPTPDGGPDTLDAYVYVHPADRATVRLAITRFANLYAGIALPLSAQTEEVWTSTYDTPGDWGGHCVPLVGYTEVGPVCVTWGALKQMTWAWWERYAEESYALLSRDWVKANDNSPGDINWSALQTALNQLAA